MDRPFPLSVSARTMDHKTPTASRPGSRANDIPGLTDQKDTDRLMNIMPPTSDVRPALCPICGASTTNGVRRQSEMGVSTLHYIDTEGHLFNVTWLEVA